LWVVVAECEAEIRGFSLDDFEIISAADGVGDGDVGDGNLSERNSEENSEKNSERRKCFSEIFFGKLGEVSFGNFIFWRFKSESQQSRAEFVGDRDGEPRFFSGFFSFFFEFSGAGQQESAGENCDAGRAAAENSGEEEGERNSDRKLGGECRRGEACRGFSGRGVVGDFEFLEEGEFEFVSEKFEAVLENSRNFGSEFGELVDEEEGGRGEREDAREGDDSWLG